MSPGGFRFEGGELHGHRPGDVPRLGAPGSAPRFPKRGEAERLPVAWHAGPIGPMRGEVTITPIRRRHLARKAGGDRDVFFEVIAEWGPGPIGEDVPGLVGLPTHHVVDVAAVLEFEGAQQLARRAVDELRDPAPYRAEGPNRPACDLPALARELRVPLLRQLLT